MGFFSGHGADADGSDRKDATAWTEGGIPLASERRLQALGSEGSLFTSGLSVNEYEARELAMQRMQTEAQELQAEGIVGVSLTEKSHGWGSHVIEFFAIGTAIVPADAQSSI